MPAPLISEPAVQVSVEKKVTIKSAPQHTSLSCESEKARELP